MDCQNCEYKIANENLKNELKIEKDIMNGQIPHLPHQPTQKQMIQLAIDTIRGYRNTPYLLIYDEEKKTIIATSVHDRIKKLQQQLKESREKAKTLEEFVVWKGLTRRFSEYLKCHHRKRR